MVMMNRSIQDMSSKDISNNGLPLSENSMPECWSSDERMNSLFAEFRNRSVNSQDWDSKYRFWRKLISDWLSEKRRCSFSVSDLDIAFKRNGRTPLCLKTVVGELLRNGEIVSETEFLKESSKGWTAWAIDTMIKRPMVWSFSKLKNYVISDVVDKNTRYIHIKSIEELADLILSTVAEDTDNVPITLSLIIENCAHKSGRDDITEENAKLALLWLRNRGKAAFGSNSRNKPEFLVKISANGASEVSEAEEGLFELTEREKLMITNIERLETERNAILTRAKSSLAGGLREVAKTCVRKKREIDRSIEKQSAALLNVQTLIARIHDARSNTETLAAYKTGSEILKNYEINGLTEENVTNTMDVVSEVVSELADLQNIVSSSIGTLDSDVDLEEELQELLDATPEKSDAEEKKSAKSMLPDITDLPDLRKELSALDLRGNTDSTATAGADPSRLLAEIPPPPKTSLGSNASSSSLRKDRST